MSPVISRAHGDGAFLERLGTLLGIGVLLVYLTGLVAPSPHWLLPIGCLFALYGAVSAARMPPRGEAAGALLAAALLAAIAFKAVGEPLTDWDARSIWFFHAKMIYVSGRVLEAGLWNDPQLAWAHTDYPKLNAVVTAVWMRAFGVWNEYLPRAALALLLAPAVLLCVGYARSFAGQLFLVCVLLLKPGESLWIGSMDGILAAYAGVSVLYGGRWVAAREPRDLLAALVAAALCSGLKNEGLVLAAFAIVTTFFWARSVPRRMAALGILLFLPTGIWFVWARRNGLVNDLAAEGWFQRAFARLGDGQSLAQIAQSILRPKEVRIVVALTLTACLLRWLARRRRLDCPCWLQLAPAMSTAVLYGICLAGVYLTTPHDLSWHLETSASRTVLPISSCWLAGLAAVTLNGQGRLPMSCTPR